MADDRLVRIQAAMALLAEKLESGHGNAADVVRLRELKNEYKELVDARNERKWRGRYKDR